MYISAAKTWYPAPWEPKVIKYPVIPGASISYGRPVYLDSNGRIGLVGVTGSDSNVRFNLDGSKLVGFAMTSNSNLGPITGNECNVYTSINRLFLFRPIVYVPEPEPVYYFVVPDQTWVGSSVTVAPRGTAITDDVGVRKDLTTKHGVVRDIIKLGTFPDEWRYYWVLVELYDSVCLPT